MEVDSDCREDGLGVGRGVAPSTGHVGGVAEVDSAKDVQIQVAHTAWGWGRWGWWDEITAAGLGVGVATGGKQD